MAKNPQQGLVDPEASARNPERLQALKERSAKQYIDDGPVALYHILCALQYSEGKGHTAIVRFALDELERLYKLEDDLKKSS